MVKKYRTDIYLIDCGKGMDGGGGLNVQTYLERALVVVAQLVQKTIMHHKNDQVGIVLFGTKETKNDLEDADYNNIDVLQNIQVPTLETIKLLSTVAPGETEGDFLDAVIVATDMMVKQGGADGVRAMWLITGGHCPSNADDLEELVRALKQSKITLNLISVDFEEEDADDESRAPKSQVKQENEKVLCSFVEQLDGARQDLDDAISLSANMRTKQVLQRPTYSGALEVAPGISVAVKAYSHVRKLPPPSLKKVSATALHQLRQDEVTKRRRAAAGDEEEEEDEDAPSAKKFLAVQLDRMYRNSLNPERTFESSKELIKGYRYGKSLVPFRDNDANVLEFKGTKCLIILGYTKRVSIPRYYFMGGSEYVTAVSGDLVAAETISSLAQALEQQEMVALTRYVKNARGIVHFGILLPKIKDNYQCLIYHKLPFAEDIREYEFPCIQPENADDAVKALLPNNEHLDAMDALIDTMNLVDEDEGHEYFKPSTTYNPTIQYMYQCILHRGIHVPLISRGEDRMVADPASVAELADRVDGQRDETRLQEARALPVPAPHILESMQPPPALWNSGKGVEVCQRMKDAFPVTLSEAKQKELGAKRKNYAPDEHQAPQLSTYAVGGDADKQGGAKKKKKQKLTTLDAVLASGGATCVSSAQPVADFRSMINNKENDLWDTAVAQMTNVIARMVHTSLDDFVYPRAIEAIKELRTACIREHDPEKFNEFLHASRLNYTTDRKRKPFWALLVREGITLIHEGENPTSSVSEQEARSFLAMEEEVVIEEDQPDEEEDDELFGDIE